MDRDANLSPHIDPHTTSKDFETWFLANGGYLDRDIELTSDRSHGNLLRVKPDHSLLAASVIVSCPHTLALSWPSAQKFHYPDKLLPKCSQHVATRFMLMKQRLLGEDSPWSPYIKMLPLIFNTPLYYNSDDMAWIRGTNLGRARKVREAAWRDEYDEAMKTLFPTESAHGVTGSWTWELYLWAASIMSSRSFPGPGVFNQREGDFPTYMDNADGRAPVLIPGLDLLNHNPLSRVAWVWDLVACTITTDETLSGGNEVPNNYGQKSNEELIMGYGFSLPNNPADHFSIGFSPAIAAHIQSTKSRRSQRRENMSKMTANPKSDLAKEMSIHWVRLRADDPEFSPYFLEDLSVAVENSRERRKADVNPQPIVNLSNGCLSRKELHVLCAVLMILQKGQTAIQKYNEFLPVHPENPKQLDAARYRQTQLQILDRVLHSLHQKLLPLLKRDPDDPGELQIVRLEEVLEGTSKSLLKDLRAILNAGLKTRDAKKIRARGGTDFAFTVWLCGLWVYRQHDKRDDQQIVEPGTLFDVRCSRWLQSVGRTYHEQDDKFKRPGDHSAESQEAICAAWFDPIRNSPTGQDDDGADRSSIVASYLDAIRTAVEKHPQSLYNNNNITLARLTWCHTIITNEGVWIPNLEDVEGDDEWVLCLENQGKGDEC